MSENDYIRLTMAGQLELIRPVLGDLIGMCDVCEVAGIDLESEKEGFQTAYQASLSASEKLRRDSDGDEVEVPYDALFRAINEACYALDPNQGERPDPSRAYQWLRTTFPSDHPNYVNPERLR